MDVLEIAPGLWRWTAPHPEWKAEADWPEKVGCVYYEAPEAVVLIDPLVPAGDEERFWRALDRDLERVGRPVAVLVTTRWHERSVEQVVKRYEAIAWRRETGGPLPRGVEPIAVDPAEETLFWLPEHLALVSGDVLQAGDGSLRVCPISWLPEGATAERLATALALLRELPVELVLVSHGPPILEDGREALAQALDQAPRA